MAIKIFNKELVNAKFGALDIARIQTGTDIVWQKDIADPLPFVIDVESSATGEIIIPFHLRGSHLPFLVDIKWINLTTAGLGDGEVLGLTTSGDYTISSLQNNARYEIRIKGQFSEIRYNARVDCRDSILNIKQWGTSNKWYAFTNSFYRCSNLIITATDAPDMTNFETIGNNCSQAFSLCSSLTNEDFSNFTSKLTDGYLYCVSMFAFSNSFLGNGIENWQWDKVKNANFGTSWGGHTTANYDILLLKLDSIKGTLQTEVTLSTNAKYTPAVSGTARANIISAKSWTITDDGAV